MATAPNFSRAQLAFGRAAQAPVGFQTRVLRRRLWEKQRHIAELCHGSRSAAVKGCHGSGKTFTVAGAALHQLAINPSGKVLTIAPTLRQVKLMWEEVELARQRSLLSFPQCSTTGLRMTEERYGLGFSASKGVNAQGFHGADVLIITDESPGIQADVWDAIEGIRSAGRVRLMKLGNPTVPSGPFFDDFTRHRARTDTVTISAFDTPNLQNPATGRPFTIEELQALPADQLEDNNPIPYLITRWWVLDKWHRWGPTNPRYLSRVLGEFPSQSEYAVYSLEWVERARREPTERELQRARETGALIQVGLDVAGPGDDETTACARVNGIILKRGAWADRDPRGQVVRWLKDLDQTGFGLGVVVVDIVGIGYNFALHLADQSVPVVGFNAQFKPMDEEQFYNAKAEAYWRHRDQLKADYVSQMEGVVDEEAEAQLSAILYKETSRGLIQVEPKEEARKRGISSPDRAEAQILAFCAVIPRMQTFTWNVAPDTGW